MPTGVRFLAARTVVSSTRSHCHVFTQPVIGISDWKFSRRSCRLVSHRAWSPV
jgi:hypothetical protein